MSGLRVMVVGSGAREHALSWKLAGDAAVGDVIAAPGNAMMTDVAHVRSDVRLTDLDALVATALEENVDLVVVGPEAPLVGGVADRLVDADVAVFGPTAAAARLEGSKAFARDVCRSAGVEMAAGAAFDSLPDALAYIDSIEAPVVVKADGLAAGKGVALCETLADAEDALRAALIDGRFGDSGRRVVVEEWLHGVEASVIAICDGTRSVLLPAARDHKRLGDGDTGPNTGGMGAYSPIPELDDAALTQLQLTVFEPILGEMARRGTPYRGALFAGLMLTANGPRVLEFNARFGDPETQAILPRLEQPLAPLLWTAATRSLAGHAPLAAGSAMKTVGVTLASSGYPDAPSVGDPIEGILDARSSGALVFAAGVREPAFASGTRGVVETAGGRVLTVVGRGADIRDAADEAYAAADVIRFAGKKMRHDIGRELAAVA